MEGVGSRRGSETNPTLSFFSYFLQRVRALTFFFVVLVVFTSTAGDGCFVVWEGRVLYCICCDFCVLFRVMYNEA